jgi:LPS O-antigen subunit length determinant protein (WzzB/FepE family)
MKRTSSPQDPSDQNPHQPPYYDDDEISLWEIFDTLRARWKIIAAFGIAAPAIALGVTLFIPNQYEARGLVQLAKVGNLQAALQGGGNSQDRGGLSIPVESLPSTLQRLQSDAFALKALSSLGFPSQISGKEPKGTGLLELTARASTPEQAKQAVEYAIKSLAEQHAQQSESTVRNLEQSLASTQSELQSTRGLLQDLLKKTSGLGRLDPTIAVMMGQMQGQLVSQQAALVERQLRLQLALSPLHTEPTKAVEEVILPTGAVYPKTRLVTLVALMAGLFLGILVALLTQAWANRKQAVGPEPDQH